MIPGRSQAINPTGPGKISWTRTEKGLPKVKDLDGTALNVFWMTIPNVTDNVGCAQCDPVFGSCRKS